MRFGSGDPRTYTGLAPVFLIFSTSSATVTPPPGITEFPPASGLYYFAWGTTTSIAFLADAATTSPGATGRYVAGSIDPADRIDEVGTTLVAIGSTNFALGTTAVALGTTSVALGTTTVFLETGIGTTLIATGSTLVAIGNTAISYEVLILAQGSSGVAIGTSIFSGMAYGTTTSAYGNSLVALGMSNIALGNSNIALGTSNVALGTSNVALGTSNVALGTSAVALGTTNVAIGTTILAGLTALAVQGITVTAAIVGIGSTASSFGNSSTDPVDLFGYLKRIQENLEGNQNYIKSTGAFTILSRGSSSTLANKTITNSVSMVVKT